MTELISFSVPSTSHTSGPVASAFRELMARRLGHPFIVIPARSYAELSDNLAEGRVDFAWIPPYETMQLHDVAGVHVLLQMVRGAGGDYHSVVFVRDDSPVRALADLKGVRIGYVHHRSASGYIVAAAHLLSEDVASAAPPVFLGSHEAVIRAVASGEVDAGATFGAVVMDGETPRVEHAGWHETPPAPPCDMRVVTWAGPVPADAVCAWPGTSHSGRRALVAAFEAAADEPDDAAILRHMFGTSRFVAPDPSRLALLNSSLSILRRASRAQLEDQGEG
jgi:phosphate/phosphite/phosphonate ABC transporter binding protein